MTHLYTQILPETLVNTSVIDSQHSARVAALSDGGWVVTWMDLDNDERNNEVYQQRYSADGQPIGGEVLVNTYTESQQRAAVVTGLEGGGWVVSWNSYDQDGEAYGVFQQVYSAAGVAVGGEVQVNTFTDNSQTDTTITALSDGGWIVAWTSHQQDASYASIYQQRYSATGAAVGVETLVNTYVSWQWEPVITALSDGGWVVTWSVHTQDGDGPGIFQQRYSAAGVQIGGEVQVNTFTIGIQSEPAITALSDGGWLVSWSSYGQDSFYSAGIYQQRYASDGTPVGGEERVNTYTQGNQQDPSVVALSDGGWIVIWDSETGISSDRNVIAQRYDANGVATGGEVIINTHLPSIQNAPDATLLADGSVVLTWQSLGQDSDRTGIYQTRLGIVAAQNGTAGSDTIDGDDSDGTIFGLAGDDTLNGHGGDDALFGAQGADSLNGGAGANHLTGGAGADEFIFTTITATDVITDFEIGIDRVNLRALLAEAETVSAELNGTELWLMRCFGDLDIDRLDVRFVQNGANAEVYLDYTGAVSSSPEAEPLIVLENVDVTALSFADFIL